MPWRNDLRPGTLGRLRSRPESGWMWPLVSLAVLALSAAAAMELLVSLFRLTS